MTYYVIYGFGAMKIEGITGTINQNGRIVIPAAIRRGMGLKLGDGVVMSLEGGVLRIEPLRPRIRRDRENGHVSGDRRQPDEPMGERREEVRLEVEEWLG